VVQALFPAGAPGEDAHAAALTGEFERVYALNMGHGLALTLAAVVILSGAMVTAVAYPSHAYQTAATSGELATVHTYCRTVGSFASVSPPWQVERWWPLRIGILAAGTVLALGLLTAAKRAKAGRLKPVPT
jgi:hypothetical protein